MKCSKPYVTGGQAHACSQCLACRINRRRLWTHRIKLESLLNSVNSFLTLTYSDAEIPRTPNKTPTLSPEHLRNFLKRLRRRVEPSRFRFFAVGEYGDRTERPHYHLAIFGALNCLYGKSRYSSIYPDCCANCDLVRETWGHGNIFIGELNDVTAAYIGGYVVKKMTGSDDSRLKGRYPEFCRMSLRPGIGAGMMDEVASTLMATETLGDDVPVSLRHGKKIMPLGRYLRQRLRERVGMDKKAPAVTLEKMKNEMQPVRDFAFNNSLSLTKVVTELYAPETTRLELLEEFNKKGKKL